MRQLLDGHIRSMSSKKEKRPVSFLVDDFKMEYPFDTYNQSGQTVPGLVTKLGSVAKEKLVILTCNPDEYKNHRGQLKRPLAKVVAGVLWSLKNAIASRHL